MSAQGLKTEKEQPAMPKPKIKARNRFACDPIMRKGGVHVKAKCTNRRQSSDLIDGGIDEWQEELKYYQDASASDHGGSGADDSSGIDCIFSPSSYIAVLPSVSL